MMKRVKIGSPALITLHPQPQMTVSVNNYFTPPGFNKAKRDVTTNKEVLNTRDLNSTHIMPGLNAPFSFKKKKEQLKNQPKTT